MYSVVLMMALTGGAEVPAGHHGGGCYGSSYGCYGGGCYGGHQHGCYGGGHQHGCYGGGCFGGGCYGGGCQGGRHRLFGGHRHGCNGGGCSGYVSSCSTCNTCNTCDTCGSGGVIYGHPGTPSMTPPAVTPPAAMPAAPKATTPPKPGTAEVVPMTTIESTGSYVVEAAPQRRVIGGGIFGRRNR